MNFLTAIFVNINLLVEWSLFKKKLTFSIIFIFLKLSSSYQFLIFNDSNKCIHFLKSWTSFEMKIFVIFKTQVWNHLMIVLISFFMIFMKCVSFITIILKQSLNARIQFSFYFCIDVSMFWFLRDFVKTEKSCFLINVCNVIKTIIRTFFFISKLNNEWLLSK